MKRYLVLFLVVLFLFNCSTNNKEKEIEIPNFYTTPIINDSLVIAGEIIFKNHCATCHTMQINTSKAPDISDVLHYNEPTALYMYLLGDKGQNLLNTPKKYTIKCRVNDSISKNEAIALTEYLKQYQNYLHEINSRFK